MDEYKECIAIITEMAEEDKEARRIFLSGNQNPEKYEEIVGPVFRKHQSIIEDIMNTIGWPTISKFGTKTSKDFWLLVQHARIDLKKKGLELMEKCLDDIDMKNYAYLKDRVLLIDKKKQIYGTQATFNIETKKYEPLPTENMDKIDELRASVGLGPLDEYLNSFSAPNNS